MDLDGGTGAAPAPDSRVVTDPTNDYDDFPDHPLHGVDKAILETTRAAAREAEADGAIEAEMAEPIADMIVMRLRRANMLNETRD